MSLQLVRIENADVALGRRTILRNINWRLEPGENWAILGGNGSGKSTFLRFVRGELWPMPGHGQRFYALDGAEQTSAIGIKEKIGWVSPELQERYLQQEWTLTGRQVVQTGFRNTDFVYEKLTREEQTRAASISEFLGIEPLLARNVQQLSTGELRKILIARALAGAPQILALDEVCDGLDASARRQLLDFIERIARGGTQILYASHRAEEFIPAITHELVLDRGRIVSSGRTQVASLASPPPCSGASSERRTLQSEHQRRSDEAPLQGGLHPPLTLFRIRAANVFMERKKVLREIDWEMRSDQHWAILGANGAGKSTLLRLITGDVQPAWGGVIRRFELSPKNTIWELRAKIGYVSPSLQANYRAALTGADAIASGFFASVGLIDRVNSQQRSRVRKLLRSFGLNALADKQLREMSYGEARAVLTLRALVHEPEVLALDEPFDGLDPEAKAVLARMLERIAHNGTRLLVVTHHPGDLPRCMTHGLLLHEGRIACQGELAFVGRHPLWQRLFGRETTS
jgi:molybdate transport system ATP-binding protein